MSKKQEGDRLTREVKFLAVGLLIVLVILFGFGAYTQKKRIQVLTKEKKKVEQQAAIEQENSRWLEQQLEIRLRRENKELDKIMSKREQLIDLIYKLQFRLDPILVDIYADAILYSASKWKLHPHLIACVIMRESSFNPVARSKAGAEGPMQTLIKWHMEKIKRRGWESVEHLYIANNIDLGCEILAEYLEEKGNIRDALKKYVGDAKGTHGDYADDILTWFADSLITQQETHHEDLLATVNSFPEDLEPKVSTKKPYSIRGYIIKPTKKKIEVK